MGLDIYASTRFLKTYKKASLGLQNLAEGSIHDFINRQLADPKTVSLSYDRVANMAPPVLEIKLSGGHRLLAWYDENQLTLLDMGGHEVVGRYDINKFFHDTASREKAPKQFFPGQQSKFFIRNPDRSIPFKYESELSNEWLYFLEEEQERIFEDIASDVIDAIEEDRSLMRYFIIGGPGSGKTCILLNLLKLFADLDLEIGIIMSDLLASYTETSSNSNISQFRVKLEEIPNLDILLFDDPDSLVTLLPEQRPINAKVIIFAFDPLQLTSGMTDGSFDSWQQRDDIIIHTLGTCYRQKENVGKATKHIVDTIANSTPFLRKDKIQTFRERRKKSQN